MKLRNDLLRHKFLAISAHRQKKLLKGLDMQVRVKEDPAQFGKCGCGRSPTGKCIGWHGLTQEQFQRAQANWLEEELRKDAEQDVK
jgi:Fe-S cluster assembly ATPase SufC